MKIIFIFLVMSILFIVIYVKLSRREKFWSNINIVNNITDLKQKEIYIMQEEKSFLNDFEHYYRDYTKNNFNNQKKYIIAGEQLLIQISNEFKNKYNLLLPAKLEFINNKITIYKYEEIWRK